VPDTQTQLSARQLADLSALADGTLDPRRREEVEGWIASSDELAQIYKEQRLAVSQLHQLRADRAPASLRSRLETETRKRTTPAPRRLRFGVALGLAAAAIIAILAVALPAGTPGAPSVAQAAALAQRGPQQPGPAPDPRDPGARLNRTVQEVYFPNWAHSLGWHAVGERRDRLGGRTAVTVYYAKGGRHFAYTILATPALPQPRVSGRRLNGFVLQTLRAHGREIVTWRRDGHTCVISAAGVPIRVLQTLAAWR
jgi:hypothetical protein